MRRYMDKLLVVTLLGVGLMLFAACDFIGTELNVGGAAAPEAVLEGNTLKYGDHAYTVNGSINYKSANHKKPTFFFSFTHVPSNYQEFETVYNMLLGKSAAGVAAMIPMAIELYGRDNATGERCLRLICNSQATVNEMVRVLKTKFEASPYAPDNDQYLQRYLPAALLKGASSKNAYTPAEPYTVEMCSSPKGTKESSLANGTIHYLYILAPGWDTFQRGVEVLLPYNSETYKVFNCPDTYVQCKPIIGEWKGLK